MSVRFFDLTDKRPGCTGHPIIRLNNFLSEAKREADRIELVIDTTEVPMKALELILKKHGFKVVDTKLKNNDIYVIIAEKKTQ
ncbi:MAG: hypothetical protein J7L07_03640 [Candidatus Odinarchaeota archaeon]|nr:hypothetical protein [Candidatus Odinarchaeota archaeon]